MWIQSNTQQAGASEGSRTDTPRGPLAHWIDRIAPYAFIIVPGAFYFHTACRTPGWADATLIVSNVVDLNLGSWVNVHNLFHLLGYAWLQLFPGTNIHYQLVMLSALLGALTVHLMFLVFREITSRVPLAALGAVILMFSHSLWWHSTMLEVYTLNSSIMAGMLLFLVRYNRNRRFMNLCMLSFLTGLGCSNHLLMVLFVLGFVTVLGVLLFREKTLSLWRMTILVGFFLAGISLYLFVFVQDYHHTVNWLASRGTGRSFVETHVDALKKTLDRATGGEFKGYIFSSDMSPGEKRFWRLNYLALILYNYPSAASVLALFGFYCFWKNTSLRLTFLFFMIGLVAQIMWSGNFFIWDMYAFSMPVYLLLSVPIVFSLQYLMRRGKVGRIALLLMLPTFFAPPFVYETLSHGGCREGWVKEYFRQYPEWEQAEKTWDVVEYLMNPNKRSYRKVEAYAEKIFDVLPQKAHLWNSVGRADYPLRLYYRDLYGMRTDIRHHSLFNPFYSHEKAEKEAKKMNSSLEEGLPVYIASLSFPERLVLDQLWVLIDGSKDLEQVAGLPLGEFRKTFPEYAFEEIVLFENENISIYKVVPREVPHEGAGNGRMWVSRIPCL
jgi:hypothetical protein